MLGFIIIRCVCNLRRAKISAKIMCEGAECLEDDTYAIRDRSISVNKILRIDGLSVYCGKEYSAILGKHDERVRIHKQVQQGMDFQSTNVEDSVVLGGNNDDDSEADDCSSDASTDDGEDKAEGDSKDGDEEEGDMGDVGGEERSRR